MVKKQEDNRGEEFGNRARYRVYGGALHAIGHASSEEIRGLFEGVTGLHNPITGYEDQENLSSNNHLFL